MSAYLKSPIKIYWTLFAYWLLLPLVFVGYLFVFSASKLVTVGEVITTIPGLTLTTMIALLTFLQLVVLIVLHPYMLDERNAIFGLFLKISMVQQLISFNGIGALLCWLLYRKLSLSKQYSVVPLRIRIKVYLSLGLITVVTLLITAIRYSIQ